MPDLPISKMLSPKTLITSACHLYRTSLIKVLPFSVLLAVLVLYIKVGAQFFPPQAKHFYLQSAMLIGVALVPLCAMIFKTIEIAGKAQSTDYFTIFVIGCQKFITLFGTLISMLLVPFIVLGIGIAVYFVTLKFHFPLLAVKSLKIITLLAVYACFVSKLFAPTLVITEEQDANSALDLSAQLVKNYYWRTFAQGLGALLLLVVLVQLPGIIYFAIKGVAISHWILDVLSAGLLALIGPWSFALLLVNQYELQWRKKEQTPLANQKTSNIPLSTTTKPDNLSF